MRVPVRWLREFVDISMPTEELAHRLTMAGTEVGTIDHIGDAWQRIVIGRVEDVARHSGADNLYVARIDVGDETLTIVTAAPNLQAGFVVPVVRVGGQLDTSRAIEARRFRGIMSEGMLCAGAELGVSPDGDHIYVLEPEAPVGAELSSFLADDILDVELTPNRADCLGIIGIAREVCALTGSPLRAFAPPPVSTERSAAGPVRIEVDAPDLAPRYTARCFENIRIGPGPEWMQRRLHLCGVRPISNVVDITNYVMLETGQPLHAFDADALAESTIRVRRAREEEKLVTIDGVERALTSEMLVIADANVAVGLAGVMGGGNSEITDATKRVVLESATFESRSIRRTSRELRLTTEASKRFDKGLDVELSPLASERAAALLAQHAEAKQIGRMADVHAELPAPTRIRMHSSDITRLIGHAYEDTQVDAILGRLGFSLQRAGDELDIHVPLWRGDVEGKADIAEEVARIVGYDAIPTVLPSGQLPATHEDDGIRWETNIRTALASAGLQEVITYSLVDPSAISRLDPRLPYPDLPVDEDTIPVANPQSVERSRLRRRLLPSLLSTVASNLRYQSRVAIFEVAHVFLPPLDPLPKESRRLAIALAGQRAAASWNADPTELDFYDLKAVLQAVFDTTHVPFRVVALAGDPWLHPGRAAAVVLSSNETEPLGFMGQVHPVVASRYDIDHASVYALEIDMDPILATAHDEVTITPLPRLPAVTRDLAIVVNRSVTHDQASRSIREAGGALLEQLTLFDVYRGVGIPEGQVSLAYNLTFRAQDRTLEDTEVNQVMERIEEQVTRGLGARIRGR